MIQVLYLAHQHNIYRETRSGAVLFVHPKKIPQCILQMSAKTYPEVLYPKRSQRGVGACFLTIMDRLISALKMRGALFGCVFVAFFCSVARLFFVASHVYSAKLSNQEKCKIATKTIGTIAHSHVAILGRCSEKREDAHPA